MLLNFINILRRFIGQLNYSVTFN